MVNSWYRGFAHGQGLLCLQIHLDEAISLAYESKPLISAIRAIPEVARLILSLVPVFECITMSRDAGRHDIVFYPLFSRCEKQKNWAIEIHVQRYCDWLVLLFMTATAQATDTVEETFSFGSDAISNEDTTPSDNNCYLNSDLKVLEAILTGIY